MGPILKTIDEVAAWVEGAEEIYRDPSIPVGVVIACWVDNVAACRGDQIVLGPAKNGDSLLALRLGPAAAIPLLLQERQAFYNRLGELEIFGAIEISEGVWSLTPSLNIPGLIHCFVIVSGVPKTANWLQTTVVRIA